MKTRRMLMACCAVFILTACASQPKTEPHHWAHAVKAAKSRDDHLRLAEHYEDMARSLEANAAEERQMLKEYYAKPWKQGKRIHGMKSQAKRMVRDMEVAAEDHRKMAEYHRQIADEMVE